MTEDKGGSSKRPAKKPRKTRKSNDKAPAAQKAVFTDLPSEVLALIASYLLPPTYVAQYGIAPPYERPYPGPLMITPGLVTAGERFGSVPRGVMDVVNFASVCRLTMGAAGRAMASFGGSSRPVALAKEDKSSLNGADKKAERREEAAVPPAAANFKQSYDDVPKRTLYIQLDHLDDKGGENVRSFILAHRSTLEELVFYKCPQSHFGPRGQETTLHRLKPFQLHCPTEEVLPKLRRVQIGPKMCSVCSRAALSLIGSKKYYTRSISPSPGSSSTAEVLQYDTGPRYYEWQEDNHKHVAAPQLAHLELHTSADQHREMREMPNVSNMLARLDPSIRERLEVLTVWLRPLEMQWGGFRQQGTSSAIKGKSVQDVETELAEAVFGKKWTPAAVEQMQAEKKAKEAERLAKYKTFAKSAIPKPSKRSKEGTPANGMEPKPELNGLSNAPTPSASTTPAPATEPATLAEIDPTLEDPVPTPKGKGATHEPSPSILNGNGDQQSFSDAEDGHQPPPRRRLVSESDPTPIYGPRKGGSSAYDAMSTGIREVLDSVSLQLQNLAALRVLRSGTAMIDAVEDFKDVDTYAAWLVAPVTQLANLQYLDLGLAVVGKREVGDFPLGVALLDKTPATIRSRTPQENQILALKGKKWNLEVKSAVQEGDQWRKTLLERLVLGKPMAKPGPDDPEHRDASPAPSAAACKLPSTLKSGFVYTVDLENRAKRRGMVIPWTRKVTVDSGKTLEEVVWGERQPVML